MRSRRIDEQMAVLIESLRELRGDVRAVRMAIETGVAAHARHVARASEEKDRTRCECCGANALWIVEDVALCGKCAMKAQTGVAAHARHVAREADQEGKNERTHGG
jgi:hypothetical protein